MFGHFPDTVGQVPFDFCAHGQVLQLLGHARLAMAAHAQPIQTTQIGAEQLVSPLAVRGAPMLPGMTPALGHAPQSVQKAVVCAIRTPSRLNASPCPEAISGLGDGDHRSRKTGSKPVRSQSRHFKE